MKAMGWVKELEGKVRRGFRGHPTATLAFYGPDDRYASKVVAAIIPGEDEPVSELERWFASSLDVRSDRMIGRGVQEFLRRNGARSLIVTRGIIGCPHEEGIDYPEDEACPECPFWAGRERWSGA
jgi:hypothetical protein